MASLFQRPTKTGTAYSVQINGAQRVTIGLGSIKKADAKETHSNVNALENAAQANRQPPPSVALWADGLPDDTYGRLVAAGLVPARQPKGQAVAALTLAAHIDECIERSRGKLKPRSIELYEQAKTKLIAHFGEGRTLASVGAQQIEDWMSEMGNTLAEATVRMHGRHAKRFFLLAVKWDRITKTPFTDETPTAAIAASKKDAFVSREIAERVIAKLPTAQDRLIVGLARYAGLRHPSETDALTWTKVKADRLIAFAPKAHRFTKRGHKTEEEATREVPIDPALRPLIDAAKAEWTGADDRVITRSVNNRPRTVEEAIEKAAVRRWPNLFHSLRKSRGTEWEQKYGIATAAALLGNSPAVAARFYTGLVSEEIMREESRAAQALHAKQDKRGQTGTDDKTPAASDRSETPIMQGA